MKACELIRELQGVDPQAEVFLSFHGPPWRQSRPADRVMAFPVFDINTGEGAGDIVMIFRDAK